MNATASVAADGKSAEIWAGTQAPSGLLERGRAAAADRALQDHVAPALSSAAATAGAAQQEVVLDAVRLAKAVGKPVKLIWSREDDIARRQVPPDDGASHRGGLRRQRQGRSPGITAWSPNRSSAYTAAGRSEPPRQDRIVMKGSPIPQYPIPNKLAEHVDRGRAARGSSPWRGVGNGHNAFAVESFLDEIAKRPGQGPDRVPARTGGRRSRACRHLLRTVAEMSDWKRKREGTALGVATMVKDDTLAAGVAEVSVDRATGKIKVHNVWAAIDAGIAVQPRNLAAQTEGSIVYGARPRAAREDHHQGRPRAAVELHRLRGGAHVGRAQHRGQGGLDRQSADRRRRGRRCRWSPARSATPSRRSTGVRLRELPFAPERVRGALGA